jgi:cell wall-associated NlpC family hydrolase
MDKVMPPIIASKTVRLQFLLLVVVFSGCSSLPESNKHDTTNIKYQKLNSVKTTQTEIKKRLLSQYHEWQGVPYKFGGMSKSGVDCSGFVYLTFQQKFNRIIARTTKQMIKAGNKISKFKMLVGDLIFFKTKVNERHVGIYLGGDEFMHASASQGVTISNLSNPYWSRHYWFSSRQ